MNTTLMKILIVDDDEVMRKLLLEVLEKEGYCVQLAASGEAAAELIRAEKFPIVITDVRMLEIDGMAVLREVKKTNAKSVVIMMTGFGSMEGAVEAIKEGAFDYISKPFKLNELKTVVSRAAKQWASSNTRSRTHTINAVDAVSKGLIGNSPKIVDVYKTVARAALSASNVLIVGETGTGKELVARAIHDNSSQRSRSFCSINCGALSEAFLDKEVAEENPGTLFLNEVSALSHSLQIKLLRLIQDGDLRATSSAETKKFDVRIIAASRNELDTLVKSGRFREDLYYRLKAIMIELPPLRDRIEDLPELVSYFLARYAEKNKKAVSHISDDAMALLKAYPWPGNVRELEHVIERAVAMTGTEVLFSEDFSIQLRGPVLKPLNSLEEMEKSHIVRVLNEVNFNKSKASEVLGIDRATLYRKAQRYGIDLRGR